MTTLARPLPPRPATAPDLAALTTAQLGHAEAQAVLGQWQLDGHGAARDEVEALHWFLRAAHRGHAMAMNMAGRCHEQGWGTAADAGKAVHWYRQAVRLDLPEAKYNLANLLAARGREAEAFEWLARVPEAASPRYLMQAGALLHESPHAAFRAVGERMLARAGAV